MAYTRLSLLQTLLLTRNSLQPELCSTKAAVLHVLGAGVSPWGMLRLHADS